jgi:hypothetical protein
MLHYQFTTLEAINVTVEKAINVIFFFHYQFSLYANKFNYCSLLLLLNDRVLILRMYILFFFSFFS